MFKRVGGRLQPSDVQAGMQYGKFGAYRRLVTATIFASVKRGASWETCGWETRKRAPLPTEETEGNRSAASRDAQGYEGGVRVAGLERVPSKKSIAEGD